MTTALSDLGFQCFLGFQRGQGGIIRKRKSYCNNVRLKEREVDVCGPSKRKYLLSQALQADRKQRHVFRILKEPQCSRRHR